MQACPRYRSVDGHPCLFLQDSHGFIDCAIVLSFLLSSILSSLIIFLQVVAATEYIKKGCVVFMKELNISPDELFGTSDDVKFTINDIPTKVVSMSDENGEFLAILATDKSLSNICGDIILGKYIKEIDHIYYQGEPAIIKAYY